MERKTQVEPAATVRILFNIYDDYEIETTVNKNEF